MNRLSFDDDDDERNIDLLQITLQQANMYKVTRIIINVKVINMLRQIMNIYILYVNWIDFYSAELQIS